MKCIVVFCIVILGSMVSYSQEDSLRKEKRLEEVIIYSNKFAERKKNIVQKIDVIAAREIAQLNSQNTGDLLVNTGNVFVQKSQQGGSSPIIRGFEASRVLLVVDGIRMNNAIYRAGHLQNIISVDQNMLERVEVLYGPASTIFGSDALGGVVHMRTKMPVLSVTNKLFISGAVFGRYSTANKEKTGHFDLSIGGEKIAWLQSYNFSDFENTRMGDNYPDKYPNFGRRSQYVASINGIDSIVINSDDRIQKFSGYKQWDVTQKFLFQQKNKMSHSINLQYSATGNVPRYDRLQDVSNGLLRYTEWYYGPQKRQLAAYELNTDSAGFFTNLKSIISYQRIDESRHTREYKKPNLDNQFEKVNVWNITLDGRKLWSKHELTLGIDAQFNDIRSTARRDSITTGRTGKLNTRYPDGKNQMNYFGAYVQHLLKFGNGKFVLNDGLRLQYVSLHSTIADNSFFLFPFTKIDQKNFAITGNLGLVYMPNDQLRINAGLSTGFRSPNVDDATKIFETSTALRQLIIPNPNIKPEYTYNTEVGITKQIAGFIQFEATGFYTHFQNAIGLAPFQLNGQDSINYNGTVVRVFANQNINQAYLYGFNSSIAFDITNGFQIYSTINYTYGRAIRKNNEDLPLDHVPPLYGKTSFTFTTKLIDAEAYALYNGWKRIKDYNPAGEDNPQYATPDGTPAWFTLNLKATFNLSQHIFLQAGIENLLDRNYRYFASGFSAPGQNFILAIRTKF
ncbi:MAG: TonB-dependent receptor [Bacteroidota bacterium]|nr:TonB-dependent receptor [Bacteroidota bacterium]